MPVDGIPSARGAPSDRRPDGFRFSSIPSQQVFEGIFTALEFRKGFGLHTLNAWSRRVYKTTSERAPGAVLHCFLEGAANAHLDGHPMQLGRQKGQPVRMILTSTRETLEFRRECVPGEYIRKVSIMMSHEWLVENALELPTQPCHGKSAEQRVEWHAGAEDIRVLEDLARRTNFDSPLARLQAESLSLGLVASAFERIDGDRGHSNLSSHDHARLGRIEQMARAPGKMPTLSELAQGGGVSQSTMQRMFHSIYGCSVLQYVRQVRLDQARQMLERNSASISEIAHLTGYGSAENFATAFRKQHGLSPSDVRPGLT